jgi:protein SCO1/2
VCPLTLLGIHQALEQLGTHADRVVPVFISVDPERDTPAVLSAYVNNFDPRILALTGSVQAVAGVAHRYGIIFRKVPAGDASNSYVIEHSATLLLIDPQQRVLASISAAAAPDVIATQITRALPTGTS